MELKSSMTTICLLFLLFTAPYYSRGGSDVLDPDMYEIDYRGPETHSSIPPPDHSHGKPLIHRENAVASRKGLSGGKIGGNVKKNHG